MVDSTGCSTPIPNVSHISKGPASSATARTAYHPSPPPTFQRQSQFCAIPVPDARPPSDTVSQILGPSRGIGRRGCADPECGAVPGLPATRCALASSLPKSRPRGREEPRGMNPCTRSGGSRRSLPERTTGPIGPQNRMCRRITPHRNRTARFPLVATPGNPGVDHPTLIRPLRPP